jgi:3-deoxy-manno-octulosonate cytidylyltransferase (CMP-KDO synthetase)
LTPAIGIIPVRYGAQRFPGKPLASILGKPMVQHVYENARQAKLLEKLVVATDDERILLAAESFGAEACLTSSGHTSGTERVAEVAAQYDYPIVINIQGDEPLLRGESIDRLVEALQQETVPMASLVHRTSDLSRLDDPNIVKVVMDAAGYALYFSRSPIPYQASNGFWEHIGIYGYQRNFLLQFQGLPDSRLEKTEKLEQLRALENGYRIKILETAYSTLSVDVPEDIIKVENIIKNESHVN